jgi:hypothetical protein
LNLKEAFLRLGALSLKEQVLSLVLLWSVLGGMYLAFRGIPVYRDMQSIELELQQIAKDSSELKIPMEPTERREDLLKEIAELKIKVSDAQANNANIEELLVSEGDEDELRMAIAELARQSRVRIQENSVFTVAAPELATSTNNAASTKGVAPAPGKGVAEKPLKEHRTRAQRKADRAVRRQEEKLMKSNSAMASNSVELNKASPLLIKLGSDVAVKRPLRRLSMTGTYAAIRQFIFALDELDWMATIVQIEIQTSVRKPQPGMAQQLEVFMVLAL